MYMYIVLRERERDRVKLKLLGARKDTQTHSYHLLSKGKQCTLYVFRKVHHNSKQQDKSLDGTP